MINSTIELWESRTPPIFVVLCFMAVGVMLLGEMDNIYYKILVIVIVSLYSAFYLYLWQQERF